jgi:hypothetical protein
LTRGPSGLDPGRVGTGAGQPGFEAVWLEPWLQHLYTWRRSLSRWRKSVEAAPPGWPATWLGQSATTLCQTDLSKLVEAPFTPINTPLMVKVNTPHSTCSSLFTQKLDSSLGPIYTTRLLSLYNSLNRLLFLYNSTCDLHGRYLTILIYLNS